MIKSKEIQVKYLPAETIQQQDEFCASKHDWTNFQCTVTTDQAIFGIN